MEDGNDGPDGNGGEATGSGMDSPLEGAGP